jgi:hypothetical protein
MSIAPVTETDGYEGTLLDPNWPSAREALRTALWCWEWYSFEDELRWQEIDAEIKANMPLWARQALGWE